MSVGWGEGVRGLGLGRVEIEKNKFKKVVGSKLNGIMKKEFLINIIKNAHFIH